MVLGICERRGSKRGAESGPQALVMFIKGLRTVSRAREDETVTR